MKALRGSAGPDRSGRRSPVRRYERLRLSRLVATLLSRGTRRGPAARALRRAPERGRAQQHLLPAAVGVEGRRLAGGDASRVPVRGQGATRRLRPFARRSGDQRAVADRALPGVRGAAGMRAVPGSHRRRPRRRPSWRPSSSSGRATWRWRWSARTRPGWSTRPSTRSPRPGRRWSRRTCPTIRSRRPCGGRRRSCTCGSAVTTTRPTRSRPGRPVSSRSSPRGWTPTSSSGTTTSAAGPSLRWSSPMPSRAAGGDQG